jgi:photosynthetic reaction center cytochrome c subunit
VKLFVLVCGLFVSIHPLYGQSAADSIEAEKRIHLEALAKQIAGNESKPAGEVFRNIKILKDNTAGRLLNIMNFAYSRSLGVGCTHCHVPGDWASDEKATKNAAREMANMVGTINRTLLPSIKGLRTERPIVNCTTCHRGQTQPALSMPPSK